MSQLNPGPEGWGLVGGLSEVFNPGNAEEKYLHLRQGEEDIQRESAIKLNERLADIAREMNTRMTNELDRLNKERLPGLRKMALARHAVEAAENMLAVSTFTGLQDRYARGTNEFERMLGDTVDNTNSILNAEHKRFSEDITSVGHTMAGINRSIGSFDPATDSYFTTVMGPYKSGVPAPKPSPGAADIGRVAGVAVREGAKASAKAALGFAEGVVGGPATSLATKALLSTAPIGLKYDPKTPRIASPDPETVQTPGRLTALDTTMAPPSSTPERVRAADLADLKQNYPELFATERLGKAVTAIVTGEGSDAKDAIDALSGRELRKLEMTFRAMAAVSSALATPQKTGEKFATDTLKTQLASEGVPSSAADSFLGAIPSLKSAVERASADESVRAFYGYKAHRYADFATAVTRPTVDGVRSKVTEDMHRVGLSVRSLADMPNGKDALATYMSAGQVLADATKTERDIITPATVMASRMADSFVKGVLVSGNPMDMGVLMDRVRKAAPRLYDSQVSGQVLKGVQAAFAGYYDTADGPERERLASLGVTPESLAALDQFAGMATANTPAQQQYQVHQKMINDVQAGKLTPAQYVAVVTTNRGELAAIEPGDKPGTYRQIADASGKAISAEDYLSGGGEVPQIGNAAKAFRTYLNKNNGAIGEALDDATFMIREFPQSPTGRPVSSPGVAASQPSGAGSGLVPSSPVPLAPGGDAGDPIKGMIDKGASDAAAQRESLNAREAAIPGEVESQVRDEASRTVSGLMQPMVDKAVAEYNPPGWNHYQVYGGSRIGRGTGVNGGTRDADWYEGYMKRSNDIIAQLNESSAPKPVATAGTLGGTPNAPKVNRPTGGGVASAPKSMTGQALTA